MQQSENTPTTVTSQNSPAPHVVIPNSPLNRVPHPEDDYYRCVGLLIAQLSNNRTGWGTGTVITADGNYGILTCAHNVYDTATGGPARYTVFAPGITAGQETDVVIATPASAIRIPPAYRGATDDPHDYAVIRLTADQVPGGLGPFPTMQTIPVAELATVQVTGYPYAPPTTGALTPAMYYSRGAGYQTADARFLRYRASTLHGMSGSGVCRVDTLVGATPDLAAITGVHVSGHTATDPANSYNTAIYLTRDVIRWITEQMAA